MKRRAMARLDLRDYVQLCDAGFGFCADDETLHDFALTAGLAFAF
ncbi:MAG TPA: hypothetical protein VM737_09500 [Gemmatimonadota bacterium]|nr:hypothetical protein [Gemmatimonadota bacterium]